MDAANCTCTDDSSSLSCDVGDCLTCNEDSTVCGVMTKFDFHLDGAGFFDSWRSSFQYTKGMPNRTVSWEYFTDGDCNAYVDGFACNACYSQGGCADGFRAIRIDCSNVLDSESLPSEYSSCSPQTGGVLDVFGWMDTESWTGCPLIPLREE